jgi:hypothetical protein
MASLRDLQEARGITPTEDQWGNPVAAPAPSSGATNAAEIAAWHEQANTPPPYPKGTPYGAYFDPTNHSPDYDPNTGDYTQDPNQVYATNLPDTADKWRKEGKKFYFVNDASNKIITPEGKVIHGAAPPPEKSTGTVPAKPSPSGLESLDLAKGFYANIINKEFGGADPRAVNPVEVGINTENQWRKANPNPSYDPNSPQFKQYEKQAAQIKKDAQDRAQFQYSKADEIWRNVFAASHNEQVLQEARAARQENKVKSATAYARTVMNDQRSYDLSGLSDSERKAALSAPTGSPELIPAGAKIKPEVLQAVNQVLKEAGLAPYKEVIDPSTSKPAYHQEILGYQVPGTANPAVTGYKRVQGSSGAAPSGAAMSEADARSALAAKGIVGANQERYINFYKANGKVQ